MKKKSRVDISFRLTFLVLGILCGPSLSAQSTVDCVSVIGNTASTESTYRVPVNNAYKYSLSETVVLASEIAGGAQDIVSISFFCNAYTLSSKSNCSIYIQATDKTSFASVDNIVILDSAAQPVYSGSLNCNQGWNTFAFRQPFPYDGTSNLLIIVDDNSNDKDGRTATFRSTTCHDSLAVVWYHDVENPDPHSASFSGYKSIHAYRPLMRLDGIRSSSIPFVEQFDNLTTGIPSSWSAVGNWHVTDNGFNNTSGLSADTSAELHSPWIALPQSTDTLRVSFRLKKSEDSQIFTVRTQTYSSSTTQVSQDLFMGTLAEYPSNQWSQVAVVVARSALCHTNDSVLRFVFSTSAAVTIDDISITSVTPRGLAHTLTPETPFVQTFDDALTPEDVGWAQTTPQPYWFIVPNTTTSCLALRGTSEYDNWVLSPIITIPQSRDCDSLLISFSYTSDDSARRVMPVVFNVDRTTQTNTSWLVPTSGWSQFQHSMTVGPLQSFRLAFPSHSISRLQIDSVMVCLKHMYRCSTQAVPPSGGCVLGAGVYVQGDSARLTALPNDGFVFSHWTSPASIENDTNPSISVCMIEDFLAQANFVPQTNTTTDTVERIINVCPTASIVVESNNVQWGRVSGAGDYPIGSEAEVMAIPYHRCVFLGWTDGATENPRRLTVDEQGRRIGAIFGLATDR